jgi:hypothetical protein
MHHVVRSLLLVPVLLLIASCNSQKDKDDRATEPFRRFADKMEGRLQAAVRLLSIAPFQLSEIPGSDSEPSVKVTYDVKRSMSTVTPDDYSATLTVTLRSDGETSSVTAEYAFTGGKWQTSKIGDTGPIERQFQKLEERRRAYLLKTAGDKTDKEKQATLDFANAVSISKEISSMLKYSDGDSKPSSK